MGKDYYEVLGVSKDADEDQLKKGAWRSHCCDSFTRPVEVMSGSARSLCCVCLIACSWIPLMDALVCMVQPTGSWQ